MPRVVRNPNREKAHQIWIEHDGNITNRQIAELLGEKEKTISAWKCRDKWSVVLQKEKCSTTKNNCSTTIKNVPEPFPGQCEAIGHKSGERCKNKALEGERFCRIHLDGWEGQCTAQSKQTGERCRKKAEPGKDKCKFHGGKSTGPSPGSQNARKHGLFSQFVPEEEKEEANAFMEQVDEMSSLDILWERIKFLCYKIARSEMIAWVRDKEDQTKVLKRKKESVNSDEVEYEIQHAWDKNNSYLTALAKIEKELDAKIKLYEELLEKNDRKGLATEEHKLRIEKLKAEIGSIQKPEGEETEDWIASLEEVANRRRNKVSGDG